MFIHTCILFKNEDNFEIFNYESCFFSPFTILFLSFGNAHISFIMKYNKLSHFTKGVKYFTDCELGKKRKMSLIFSSTSGSQRLRHEFIVNLHLTIPCHCSVLLQRALIISRVSKHSSKSQHISINSHFMYYNILILIHYTYTFI